MVARKVILLVSILFFSLTFASAISWSGGITTLIDTNATTACTGGQVLFGNGSCGVISGGGGSGDITSVQGDIYITNGSNSGAVNLVFNETQLNDTIDNRIPAATNPFDQELNQSSNVNFGNVTTVGFFTGIFNWIINLADSSPAYLTFNGTTLSFDEGQLNTTIDSRSSAVANLSLRNIFDQDLNKSSNVNFGNLTILNNLSVGGNTLFVGTNGKVGIGTASPQSLLNLNSTPGDITSGLTFGDGDTGIYELVDDILVLDAGNASIWRISRGNADFASSKARGPALVSSNTDETNPVIIPNRDDKDTGMGGFIDATTDTLALIAGGVNILNVVETGGNGFVGIGTTTPQATLNVVGTLNVTGGINLSSYISCTALETDANGNLLCGSDDTGGGGGNPFDQVLNTTSNVSFGNVTSVGTFNGLFNWTINSISSIYLIFNGNELTFNETRLNETISDLNIDTNDSIALASVNTTTNIEALGFTQGAHTTDTNETVRLQNLTTYSCSGTDKVTGVHPNGTVICSADTTIADTTIANETVRLQNLTTYSCSGTDKVTGVHPNGTVICGTDTGGTNTWELNLTSGVTADLNPFTDLVQSLGTLIKRWNNIFAGGGFFGVVNATEGNFTTLRIAGTDVVAGPHTTDTNDSIALASVNTTTNIEALGFTQGAHTTDTNETVRLQNLTTYSCSGTDKVTGVHPNGTVICSADIDTTIADTTIANETVRFNELVQGDCTSGELVIGVQPNGTVNCVTDAGGGGGNPFDQVLNTTSNVTFRGINITNASNSLGLFQGANARVGVGTASPSHELHVSAPSDVAFQLESVDSSVVDFIMRNTDNSWRQTVQATTGIWTLRDDTAGVNVFQIESGANADSLRIDASGRVGTKGSVAGSPFTNPAVFEILTTIISNLSNEEFAASKVTSIVTLVSYCNPPIQ